MRAEMKVTRRLGCTDCSGGQCGFAVATRFHRDIRRTSTYPALMDGLNDHQIGGAPTRRAMCQRVGRPPLMCPRRSSNPLRAGGGVSLRKSHHRDSADETGDPGGQDQRDHRTLRRRRSTQGRKRPQIVAQRVEELLADYSAESDQIEMRTALRGEWRDSVVAVFFDLTIIDV